MNCVGRMSFLFSGLGIVVGTVGVISLAGCDSPKPEVQTPVTWHESFDDAKKLAKESGKPILADFTGSDWCIWCKRLQAEVFDTPEFTEWAEGNVVLLEVDYPQYKAQDPAIVAQNESLSKRYAEYVPGYPTILFLTAEGEVIGVSGYLPGGPKAWIAEAEGKLSGAAQPAGISGEKI